MALPRSAGLLFPLLALVILAAASKPKQLTGFDSEAKKLLAGMTLDEKIGR